MNDLLWLVNHPVQGNVMSLQTSQNSDTPEALESRLSVRIHRIPAELLHSTEQELGKLRRIHSYSKDSQQARKSSDP
jgi:hypothetical protein